MAPDLNRIPWAYLCLMSLFSPFTCRNQQYVCCRRFPWDSIPGVVIGRVAYDNWLVLNAIQRKQVVVDVSKTVLAVHQTTK